MAHKDNTAAKQEEPAPHAQARALIDAEDYPAARDLLLHTLKAGKTAALYCDLGEVYSYMGNKNEAVITFETAIKLDPRCHKAYACIAELLLSEGHIFHAIDYYALAIKAAPDEKRYITIFLTLARNLHLKSFNKNLKELLTGFLRRSDIDVSPASRVWLELLWRDPSFKDFTKILKKDGEARYDLFSKAARQNKRSLLDPYFLLGIRLLIVPGMDFEILLTCLRRFMLEQLESANPVFSKDEFVQIADALSGNCLLTEYVFQATEEESLKIDTLKSKMESHYAGDEAALSILACYTHISALQNAENISTALKKSPSAAMQEFARTHIDDFMEQQAIKKTIPALTKITDTVSSRVREQYEAFPYPRWKNFNPLLQGNSPAEAPLKDRPITILNAGCGTGQEAAVLAAVFPQAKVLAVDLSLTSLAYAAKRARDLGIGNIDFRQGDILALGALDQKFDYIASGGVLHHLEDPARGLAVLTGLLKPDGIMRLGLYSETARRFVVDARRVIKDKSFQSSAADIRRFRQDAANLLSKEAYKGLCDFRDYFTLSECRDLLFHVQEHRCTIPQLKKWLDDQGLAFIRFHSQPQVEALYKKAYPEDKECMNLDNWHTFEQKYPDTFIEMYKFWCRKKAL